MFYSTLTYIFFSFLILYFCARISYKLQLVDVPNYRKVHSKATAFTGGIAISLTYIFCILFFQPYTNDLNLILSMSFLIAIFGFVDDKFDLSVTTKLSLQVIPAIYLIFFQKIALFNLGEYTFFKIELGIMSIPFTTFCVLLLVNSFNYFDGIDGTLSFTSISVLAILYFLLHGQELQSFLIFILIPIGTFLCFNFSLFKLPKIFLGDSGSLQLGFIISFLLIYIANQNIIHPILLAWSIVIFVYEFLAINLIRFNSKKSPLEAGRDHLHHVFYKKTNSVFLTNFLMTMLNIVLFIIGFLSFSLAGPLSSLILFVFLFFIFFIFRNIYSNIF